MQLYVAKKLSSQSDGRSGATAGLSTLPAETPITELVETAKLRRRIERDFQDLKQEIGLDPYEGRGRRGFHHHAALPRSSARSLIKSRTTRKAADFKVVPDSPLLWEWFQLVVYGRAGYWSPPGARSNRGDAEQALRAKLQFGSKLDPAHYRTL